MTATSRRTISIAMAVFNGERYLPEQLDSIASQTRLPDEMVIADDASLDDSLGVIRRFSKNAPFPVRLVRHPNNVGILENFYSAFDATTGDIIFYCDQDDVWRTDKIARIMASLQPGTTLAMHQSEIVGPALEPLHRVAPGNARYGRFAFPADTGTIHGYGHQMAFPKRVLGLMHRLRPSSEAVSPSGFARDLDRYIPFCASLLGDIVALAEPLVRFRRHASATSPAGAASTGAVGWGERTRYLIERDITRIGLRIAILERAAADGALPRSQALRLLRPLRSQAAIAHRQQAALVARGLARIAAPGVLVPGLAGGGFSNDRRLRALGLGCIAALVPRRPADRPGHAGLAG